MAATISIKISAAQAEGAIKKLELLFDKFERSVKSLLSGIKTFESTLNKFGKSATNLASKVSTLDSNMKKLKPAVQGVDDANKKVAASTDKTKKGIKNLIPHVAMVTASYMAMRKALRAVTGLFGEVAEFEHIMTRVGAVSGASAEQLDKLTEAARAAGEGTIWTATEAGEALKFLAMAGFNVEEQIGALPGVLQLATVGELDLGKATDIVTDTLNAMGLEVSELPRVLDVFAATITSTNTDIKMMGQAMQYAAPMAGQLGYEVEEVSAMIGILSQSGVKAGKAGRGMQQMFLRTAKAAKGLGLAVGTKLMDVIEALNEKQKELTKTLGENVAKTLIAAEANEYFGRVAVKHVLILMGNIDAYKELKGELDNSAGSMEKMVEIIERDIVNSFKKLQSMIVGTAIASLYKYREEIREVIEHTTNWIKANQDLIAQKVWLAIDSMWVSMSKLVAIYNALPDGVIGAAGTGLIGRMLFGSKTAGWIVAAIYMAATAIDKAWAAATKFDEEVLGMGGGTGYITTDLITMFETIGNKILDIEIAGVNIWTGYKKVADVIETDVIPALDHWDVHAQQMQMDSWQLITQRAKEYAAQVKTTEMAEIDARANATIANDKFAEKYEEEIKGQYQASIDALNKEMAAWEKQGVKKGLIVQITAVKIAEIEEKRSADSLQLIRDEVEKKSSYYNALYSSTEAPMKKFYNEEAKAAKNATKIVKDANEEIEKDTLDRFKATTVPMKLFYETEAEWSKKSKQEIMDDLEEVHEATEKSYIENLKESENFFDVLEGYRLEDQDKWISWGNYLATTFNDMTESISDSWKSNISDVITGDISSMSDFWDSILDDMLRSFADWVANILVEWAKMQLFGDSGLLGSLGLGGSGGGGGILSGIASWVGDQLGLTGEGGLLSSLGESLGLTGEGGLLTGLFSSGGDISSWMAATEAWQAGEVGLVGTGGVGVASTLPAYGSAGYQAMLGSASYVGPGGSAAGAGAGAAGTAAGIAAWAAVAYMTLEGMDWRRKLESYLKDLQQQFSDYYDTLEDSEKAANTFAAAQMNLTDMTLDLNSAFFLTQATLGDAHLGEYTELAKLHGETVEEVKERYEALGDAIQEFGYYIQYGRYVPEDMEDFIKSMVTGIESAVGAKDIEKMTFGVDVDLDYMVAEGLITMDEYYEKAVEGAEKAINEIKSGMQDLSTAEQDYVNAMLGVWTDSTTRRTALSQSFFDSAEEGYRGLTQVEQEWVLQALTDYESLTTTGTEAAQAFYESQVASYDMLSEAEQAWAYNALSTMTEFYDGATALSSAFLEKNREDYETATTIIERYAKDTSDVFHDYIGSLYPELGAFYEEGTGYIEDTASAAENAISSITGEMTAAIGATTSSWGSLTDSIDGWSPGSKVIDIVYNVQNIPGFQHGGIASGPMSGYPVMLHGTEKITPLGGGREDSGGNAGPINIRIDLGNAGVFDAYVKSLADGVRVRAEKRDMGTNRIYN